MTEAGGPGGRSREAAVPAMMARVRSVLFMPGNRPDMIAKIPGCRPDVAVADLEDAVPAVGKAAARSLAAAAVNTLTPAETVVLIRVNPVGSPWFDDDIGAAAASRAAGVVVPKLNAPADVLRARRSLAAAGRGEAVLIGGIETARGVADVRLILSQGLSAVYFGAEDYVADLGGQRSRSGEEVLFARSAVSLAARLADIPAIDQAVVDVHDTAQFVADAEAGARLGYQGKTCIHPRQVELAQRLFSPSPDQVAQARAVLAAGAAGVATLDGQMIDEVHLRMARRTLTRAAGDPAATR